MWRRPEVHRVIATPMRGCHRWGRLVVGQGRDGRPRPRVIGWGRPINPTGMQGRPRPRVIGRGRPITPMRARHVAGQVRRRPGQLVPGGHGPRGLLQRGVPGRGRAGWGRAGWGSVGQAQAPETRARARLPAYQALHQQKGTFLANVLMSTYRTCSPLQAICK